MTQALCNVDPHRDVLEDAIYTRGFTSEAFWFDDETVRFMEENGTSVEEMSSAIDVGDMKKPVESYYFYQHYLTYDFKTTTAYKSVTVNGKEMRSNEVYYVWSGDKQKIVDAYADK